MRLAFVASTAGSVMRAALHAAPGLRASTALLVVDRPCGATQVAADHEIPIATLGAHDRDQLGEELESVLTTNQIDYAFLFFERVLGGPVLDSFRDRIVNFHPSLLPASAGTDGFGDSVRSGALTIGSTVHFIRTTIDSGPQILQALTVVPPSGDLTALRHEIFVQQVRSAIQTHDWLSDDRVHVVGDRVEVRDAKYGLGPFVPHLDSRAALAFSTALRA